MLKIVRPVSFLLLSAALCSSGTVFASNGTATPKVGISQQQKSLKGTVNDALGPVAGASVVVKGTTNGTVTDMDGNFVLDVNNGDILQVSFIGYVTQDIKYTGQATLTVNLVEDTQKLEEEIVGIYGLAYHSEYHEARLPRPFVQRQREQGAQVGQTLILGII